MPPSIGGSGEYRPVGRLGIDKIRRTGECDQPSQTAGSPFNPDRHSTLHVPSARLQSVPSPGITYRNGSSVGLGLGNRTQATIGNDFRSSACDIVLMEPYRAATRTIAVDKYRVPQ